MAVVPVADAGAGTAAELVLGGLTKRFGEFVAVEGLDLEVRSGELVSLLGPSGCGKTTTLRMIAGFELPDAGSVHLGARDVTYAPASRRNIGMVFQSYALFPHLTVLDNVAFGLRMRKTSRDDAQRRARQALERVQLGGFEKRYPRELSGGQQQRVAVARAIVIEPQLLLLDEPLSNLDAKLRAAMRVELRMLQQEIGIATVFVTHDQEEALAVSDVMVVMNEGRIVQSGTPIEVYENPASGFVASFLGQDNAFRGEIVDRRAEHVMVRLDNGLVVQAAAGTAHGPGDRVLVLLRKERLGLDEGATSESVNVLPAQVEYVNYLGSTIEYLCSAEGQRVLVSVQNSSGLLGLKIGDAVRITFGPDDCLCLRER